MSQAASITEHVTVSTLPGASAKSAATEEMTLPLPAEPAAPRPKRSLEPQDSGNSTEKQPRKHPCASLNAAELEATSPVSEPSGRPKRSLERPLPNYAEEQPRKHAAPAPHFDSIAPELERITLSANGTSRGGAEDSDDEAPGSAVGHSSPQDTISPQLERISLSCQALLLEQEGRLHDGVRQANGAEAGARAARWYLEHGKAKEALDLLDDLGDRRAWDADTLCLYGRCKAALGNNYQVWICQLSFLSSKLDAL